MDSTDYTLQSGFNQNFNLTEEEVKFAILGACRDGCIRDYRKIQAGLTGAYNQVNGTHTGIIIRCEEEDDYLRLWKKGLDTDEGLIPLFGKRDHKQREAIKYKCTVSGVPLAADENDVIRVFKRSMATNQPVGHEIEGIERDCITLAPGTQPVPTNKWFVTLKTTTPGQFIKKGCFQPKIVDEFQGYHVRFWFDCLSTKDERKPAPPLVPMELRQFDDQFNFRGYHPQQQTQQQQTQPQPTPVQQPQEEQPQLTTNT